MFVGAATAGGGAGPNRCVSWLHNSFFSVFHLSTEECLSPTLMLRRRGLGADYLSRQYVPPPRHPLVRRLYVAVVVVSSL